MSKSSRYFVALWAVAALLMCCTSFAADQPNIVFIYADDLGYGDVGCYGAARVKTPNIDRLASEGLRFTDAHSSSATCTPSRYALMTGEYPWRKKGTGILPADAALIIQPGRFTLPAMLKKSGYTTGAVGKWHLGLGSGNIDWNGDITPGPLEIGFDYCFIMPATGDRVPCVFVENHRVVGLDPKDPLQVSYERKVGDEPTGRERPDLLKMNIPHGHDGTIQDGISRIGFMSGGKNARWKDENLADDLTRKAVEFIERNKAKPFFLYFATHDIHVPRVPHPRFKGTSGCGVRGDVIQEFDWTVGEVMNTLDRLNLSSNTIFIVTSDNGPVVEDGYQDGALQNLNGHKPGGQFRGGKYNYYEAGTRIPFVLRWPARMSKPGVSDALVCQIDLLASFAALTGAKLPADAAPDSFNMLDAFLGKDNHGRDYLVEHGPGIALRKNSWKLFPPPAKKAEQKGATELFDLTRDPGESSDVASKEPGLIKELPAKLEEIRNKPQSRP